MSSNLVETRLGSFTLCFAPEGKLRQLTAHAIPLLHEGGHQFPISPTKSFTVAGWDECFPTIEPTADSPVMGLLAGTSPELTLTPVAALQTWSLPNFTATRRFQLNSTGHLQMRFTARNISAQPRPFLWASHALFSLENVREIALPNRRLQNLALDGSTSKSFLANTSSAQILRDNITITLTTEQPWWGIWLNQGGWPAAAPANFRCIGLEPTTTNADHPTTDLLHPNQSFHGTITLQAQLHPPP